MKSVLGFRVAVAMFVAVLMPLELGHCALMPLRASAAAIESGHHDDGDRDCCPESAASPDPTDPTAPADPCCCAFVLLPVATAPAPISLDTPAPVPTAFAVVPIIAVSVDAQGASARLEPDARSGSPPDPSAAPQSPRGPPYSAQHPVLVLT